MMTLLIPNSIPAADRRDALKAAKRSARMHEVVMRLSGKRGDLVAFGHAKTLYRKAMDRVRAWEGVQIGEMVS